MATSFAAVNTTLDAPARKRAANDDNTPTTPKPSARFSSQPPKEIPIVEDSTTTKTPTRDSFGGVPGQRPLPDEPLTSVHAPSTPSQDASLKRGGSGRSVTSPQSSCSRDVEMGEGDGDDKDDEDESDNDSVTSDSHRPSKKKKGQRFFCENFPPCQLSFTRSEHLARHIRKHTGERPFMCHCSRRFSRLDNLRQHAQTVHVNEEIPGDSLAATSTRFQRQIRTDRVRPPNNRSRASTMGSQGGHSRGHSRNLSSSSIGSTTSSVGINEDVRRRPPPLAMAGDGTKRAMGAIETYNSVTGSPGQQYAYFNHSPTGYSTPTSTTFSAGPGSPGYPSGMTSPSSNLSRSSFYNGARTSRRLSVPSGVHPYQNPPSGPYPPAFFSPNPPAPSMGFSQNSSVFASPTSSVFSHGRRESEAELEYRRRTWHPGTNLNYQQRPATSGLSYHQTPDEPRPALSQQPAASQVTRLPGIESFDHAPPPTALQQSSPMMVDASPRPLSSGRPSDAGLHQNLTRLDIAGANASTNESPWQGGQAAAGPQTSYFIPQAAGMPPYYTRPQHASMPEQPVTPRRNKRQAWYGGPVGPSHSQQQQPGYTTHRPSPEDSGSSDGVPTPLTFQGSEYHPVIVNHSEPHPPGSMVVDEAGQQKVYYTAPYSQIQQPQPQSAEKPEPSRTDSGFQTYAPASTAPGSEGPQRQPTYTLQAGHDPRFSVGYMQAPSQHHNDMGRLEALVAVATSENRAVENRH